MKLEIRQEIKRIIKEENLNCSVKEFKDEAYWLHISEYQKLSKGFIREFKEEVNWSCISIHQKLSEKFIKEFKNKIDWNFISVYQKLSEKFIREFKDRLFFEEINYSNNDELLKYICKQKNEIYRNNLKILLKERL